MRKATGRSRPKRTAQTAQEAAGAGAVLVTGASGSVGHLLTRQLVESGRKVVVTDLPGTNLPADGRGRIVQRPGDLTSAAFVEGVAKGVTQVVHAAAIIDIGMPYEKLRAVNVDATKALYTASRANGVGRFVFFSSGSAYKERRDGIFYEDCRLGAGNDYERSKIDCEEFLRAEERGGPPSVTVIRPSLIYGPRGRMLAATLMAMPPILNLTMPRLPVLKGGPRSNWVHAEDVARAVAFVLDHPETAGETYNVGDELPATIGEILEFAVDAYGYPKGLTLPYPMAFMRAAAPLLERSAVPFEVLTRFLQVLWDLICRKHRLESKIRPKIDREAVPYAVVDTIFANGKLKRLGFRYKYPSSRVGILHTIRWYQDEGWVPRVKEKAPRRKWRGALWARRGGGGD